MDFEECAAKARTVIYSRSERGRPVVELAGLGVEVCPDEGKLDRFRAAGDCITEAKVTVALMVQEALTAGTVVRRPKIGGVLVPFRA